MLREYLGAGQQHESHKLQSQHPRHLFDRWTAGKGSDEFSLAHLRTRPLLDRVTHASKPVAGVKIIFQRSRFFRSGHRMRGGRKFLRETSPAFDARSSIFPLLSLLFFDVNRIETIYKRGKIRVYVFSPPRVRISVVY